MTRARPRTIDWDRLRAEALDAASYAYCPYSHFQVGAAGLLDDGRIVSGCNVENVSYGLSTCAEVGLAHAVHRSGGGRLVAVVTVGNGAPAMPCGRCRQVLYEFGGPECLVDGDGTPRRLADLLAHAFTANDLHGT